MKIALCFSGLMRDVDETKQFWTELINKYKMDVYASFWDVENEKLNDTFKNFSEIYKPKVLDVESYDTFRIGTQELMSMHIEPPKDLPLHLQYSVKDAWIGPMWYKIWRCNNLCNASGEKYDLVIRARVDTTLDNKFEIVKNDMLNVPMGNNRCNAWGEESIGINDCFAYGTPTIMNYYSFLFLQLMNYHNEGHYLFPPEHLIAVHFSKVKMHIRYFPNYMVITRISKGTPHEIYNNFVTDIKETIVWSNNKKFVPDTVNLNFKRPIIDTFKP